MQKKSILTVLTIAGVTAATLSTAALADRWGGHEGRGAGPMMMPMMMPMLDFEEMDADKDGKITEAEITAHRQARVAAADANGDGKLSAEELAALHLQQMQARASQRAERMIEAMDSDGDGLLSAAEMMVGPSPMPMFERLDTDGDGAISQAEAEAAQDMMPGGMGRRGGHGWGFGRGHN